ncbi:MAG: hypothetical protein KBT36_10345 [Kurthia sp.]|nr:hypothetical protein [Candidatus Kurthia equi]
MKRDLLGSKYDEERPIMNILRAKKNENYQNKKTDYHRKKIGHLENLQKVEAVFQTITDFK